MKRIFQRSVPLLLLLLLLLVLFLSQALRENRLRDALEACPQQLVVAVQSSAGWGTGMIVGQSVLTVFHVVEGDDSVGVYVGDGPQADARVMYTNPELDIARLELACVIEETAQTSFAIYEPAAPLESDQVRTYRSAWFFETRFREVSGYDFAEAEMHFLRLAERIADSVMEERRSEHEKLFNETELEALRQKSVETAMDALEERVGQTTFAFRSSTVGKGSSGAPVLVVQEGQTRVAGIVTDRFDEEGPIDTIFVVSMREICHDLAENDVDLCGLND